MKTSSTQLLQDLQGLSKQHLNFATQLKQLENTQLQWKANAESWSVLECLEHMNLYGDFYLPEIKRAIESSKHEAEEIFKSGLLGNYFAESMLPKENLNKKKTFADKNPINSHLDTSIIQRFIEQQNELLSLLVKAEKVSLHKTKTSISISKFFKLKLGDTFRFFIYHNERHIHQIQRILKQQNRL